MLFFERLSDRSADRLADEVVLLNLVVLLVTGRRNDNLSQFGAQAGDYLMQIIRFATLNSEVRPFPFGEWPDSEESETAAEPEPAQSAPASEAETKKTTRKAPGKTAKKKSTRKKTSKKTSKKSTGSASKKSSSG